MSLSGMSGTRKAGKPLEDALTNEDASLEELKGMMKAAMDRVEGAIEKIKHDEMHLERERQKLAADQQDVRERQAEVSRLREELAAAQAKGRGFLCCFSKPPPAPELVVPQ